jgi:hypothetical protein
MIEPSAQPKLRPLPDVIADLTKAADTVKLKKKAMEDASMAANKAATEYQDAQVAAARLRQEFDEQMNLLVPSSMQGRVRQ